MTLNYADRGQSDGGNSSLKQTSQDRPLATYWIVSLALMASALAVLPLFTSRHLPLLDAPAHEARLAVLRDLLITGQGSPFYELSTFFVPNIAFDVVGLGLIRWLAPETVGKIFFGLTLLATLWGVLVLNRVAVGRWSVVPVAALLVLFNLVTILGFLNYTFGLALVMWALALRLRLDRASPAVTLPVGAGMAVILLFCHVAAFGIYAVMCGGSAIVALLQRRSGSFGLVCLRAVEFIPAISLFFAMSISGEGNPRYYSPFWLSKLIGIAKSMTAGSVPADIAFLVGAAAGLALLAAFCSRLRLVVAMVPGLGALCMLYVALPPMIGSGAYIDARLPSAIWLLGLASLDLRVRRCALSAVLITLIAATAVVKQGVLALQWRSFDQQIDTIATALDTLPPRSIILQTECQPNAIDIIAVYRTRQPSMTNLASIASFNNTRFSSSTFAIAGQQPIRVASMFRPYYSLQGSLPIACDALEYRKALDRLIALHTSQQAAAREETTLLYFLLIRPPKPKTLTSEAPLVAEGQDFELYAVPQK
jgi:hypothetical protein